MKPAEPGTRWSWRQTFTAHGPEWTDADPEEIRLEIRKRTAELADLLAQFPDPAGEGSDELAHLLVKLNRAVFLLEDHHGG